MGITNIQWRFYLLFCVFNVLAAIFTWFAVKETKGLSLEEIDLLFAKKEYKHVLEAKLRGGWPDEKKGEEEMVEDTA